MNIYKQMDIIGASYKSIVHTVSTTALIPSEYRCEENNNIKYMHNKLYNVSFLYMPFKHKHIIHTQRLMLLPAVEDHVAVSSCAKVIR